MLQQKVFAETMEKITTEFKTINSYSDIKKMESIIHECVEHAYNRGWNACTEHEAALRLESLANRFNKS